MEPLLARISELEHRLEHLTHAARRRENDGTGASHGPFE
jgi:hypothetical protein